MFERKDIESIKCKSSSSPHICRWIVETLKEISSNRRATVAELMGVSSATLNAYTSHKRETPIPVDKFLHAYRTLVSKPTLMLVKIQHGAEVVWENDGRGIGFTEKARLLEYIRENVLEIAQDYGNYYLVITERPYPAGWLLDYEDVEDSSNMMRSFEQASMAGMQELHVLISELHNKYAYKPFNYAPQYESLYAIKINGILQWVLSKYETESKDATEGYPVACFTNRELAQQVADELGMTEDMVEVVEYTPPSFFCYIVDSQ